MKKLLVVIALLAGCSSGKKAPPVTAAPQQPVPAQASQTASGNNLQRGLALERRGDLDGALQAYRLAYENAPEADGTAYALSRILARRGDVSSAASITAAGLKKRPDDVDLLTFKAVIARLQADNQGAIIAAKAALARAPFAPKATVELARALIKQKKTQLAMSMLERSAEANPRDPQVHVAMSEVASAMGDDSRALAELLAAAERDPQSSAIQGRIGSLALEHRDYVRAKAAFQKAIALGDDSSASARGLEVAMTQTGDSKGKAP
jgi:tetratricopeptide (TPR) repeat protein